MLNLDTHIVVFSLADMLSDSERETLEADRWGISPIVLWELSKLVEMKRIKLDLDGYNFKRFLNSVEVLPIDLKVARTSVQLDFSSDLADELIVATSIVYGIPLVTRDRVIRSSELVPLAV